MCPLVEAASFAIKLWFNLVLGKLFLYQYIRGHSGYFEYTQNAEISIFYEIYGWQVTQVMMYSQFRIYEKDSQ